MIKKSFYEAPEAELLLVKFERNFCGTNDEKPNSSSSGYDDENELGTI